MKFKTRDFVVGTIVIIIVVIAGLFYKNLKSPKSLPTPTPFSMKNEDAKGIYNFQIPEDVESTELKDVIGGDSRAIATRDFTDGLFTHAVLADIPDLEEGFYEGWLVKNDGKFISTGKLRVAKGGYLLEFSSTTDYSDYKKVVITKELKDDVTPEVHVLEGSF